MENIIVGTDLQPKSLPAINAAVSLAKRTGGRVTLVHVINNMVMHTATFPDPLGNLENMNVTTDLQILEEQQRVVEETFGQIKSRFDFPLESRIVYGSLDEGLLDAAKEMNADLMVIGTHESSGLLRFLSGDVSGSIIHHTKIPVLVVPSEIE